jgi:hypothetical protein
MRAGLRRHYLATFAVSVKLFRHRGAARNGGGHLSDTKQVLANLDLRPCPACTLKIGSLLLGTGSLIFPREACAGPGNSEANCPLG